MKKTLVTLLGIIALLCAALFLTSCDEVEIDRSGTFDITFINGDETLFTVPCDAENNRVTPLKRKGLEFLGYFTEPDGGFRYFDERGVQAPDIIISQATTLYAQWKKTGYIIRFFGDDGTTSLGSVTVNQGDTLTFPPVTPESSMNFIGWADTNGTLHSEGNRLIKTVFDCADYPFGADNVTSLYVRTGIKTFEVVLHFGADKTETRYYSYGDPLGTLPMEDTGSEEIVEWSTDPYIYREVPEEVYGYLDLYARWRSYKMITLDFGTGNTEKLKVVDSGSSTRLPTPTRQGYEFAGWYPNTNFSGFPLTSIAYSTSYSILYAKWEPV